MSKGEHGIVFKSYSTSNPINTTEGKIKKEKDQEVVILLRRVEVIIIFETATGIRLLRVY